MTKAAKSIQSKAVNLALATDVDRAERNRLRELIAQHGAAKVAGIAAAGTGGLIGAAILGKRLLLPEEEAAVLQEKEANGVLPAAAVGLTGSGLMALRLASLMDGDEEEYLTLAVRWKRCLDVTWMSLNISKQCAMEMFTPLMWRLKTPSALVDLVGFNL